MRQPTFRRGRARQQRLIRTGIGVVGFIAIAALIANLVGSEPERLDTPAVSFRATATAHADSGTTEAEDRVSKSRLKDARSSVKSVLDTWYQRTFVDPDVFEARSFPPSDAMRLVTGDAREAVLRDIDTLTLGTARGEYRFVEPLKTDAIITVLFEGGTKPVMAVADVVFSARGILRQGATDPVRITQRAALHLRPTGSSWEIVYYDGEQTQRTVREGDR